jgi:hypothetical protein
MIRLIISVPGENNKSKFIVIITLMIQFDYQGRDDRLLMVDHRDKC